LFIFKHTYTSTHGSVNTKLSYSYTIIFLHVQITLPFFKTTYENLSLLAPHLPSKGNGMYDTSKLQGVVSCI